MKRHYLPCHCQIANKSEVATESGAIEITMIGSWEAAADLAEAMNDARERRLARQGDKPPENSHSA